MFRDPCLTTPRLLNNAFLLKHDEVLVQKVCTVLSGCSLKRLHMPRRRRELARRIQFQPCAQLIGPNSAVRIISIERYLHCFGLRLIAHAPLAICVADMGIPSAYQYG